MIYPSKLDRASIVAAGMDQLAREGLGGLSLRAIAAVLNVAPNALYRHVANRKGIERMLAAEVAVLLHAALMRRIDTKQSTEEAVRSMAVEYLRFAREHRLLYEALLVPRPADGPDAIGPARLWSFVLEVVTKLSGEAAAHQATVALWAFLHGIASLQSVDAFDDEKPFSSFEFGLQAWMSAAESARSSEEKVTPRKIKTSRRYATGTHR